METDDLTRTCDLRQTDRPSPADAQQRANYFVTPVETEDIGSTCDLRPTDQPGQADVQQRVSYYVPPVHSYL